MKRVGRLFRMAGAARLATYLLALWKLFQHPDTPRPVKWIAVAVLAYAVSPIDLIPDFIPVIGLLDDLILIPFGLALVKRLTPPLLWQARLAEAEAGADKLPRLWWGALAIVAIWAVIVVLFALWLLEVVGNNL